MTALRAWWGRLPMPARLALGAAVVLLAAAIAAKVWGAVVLALGGLFGAAAGRTPAHPGAAEAARKARSAAELQAASARLIAEVHRTESDADRVRDRERDRAMAEAAERAPLLDPPHGEAEGEPDFLRAVRERGGVL